MSVGRGRLGILSAIWLRQYWGWGKRVKRACGLALFLGWLGEYLYCALVA